MVPCKCLFLYLTYLICCCVAAGATSLRRVLHLPQICVTRAANARIPHPACLAFALLIISALLWSDWRYRLMCVDDTCLSSAALLASILAILLVPYFLLAGFFPRRFPRRDPALLWCVEHFSDSSVLVHHLEPGHQPIYGLYTVFPTALPSAQIPPRGKRLTAWPSPDPLVRAATHRDCDRFPIRLGDKKQGRRFGVLLLIQRGKEQNVQNLCGTTVCRAAPLRGLDPSTKNDTRGPATREGQLGGQVTGAEDRADCDLVISGHFPPPPSSAFDCFSCKCAAHRKYHPAPQFPSPSYHHLGNVTGLAIDLLDPVSPRPLGLAQLLDLSL